MTLTVEDKAAQDALRTRQGLGARYDAAAAPHDDLLQARRNTAQFARVLNETGDRDLTDTRRRIIAEVSYDARACATALEEIGGTADPYPLHDAIAQGVTLPPRALRALFQHSEIHLNVTWRDLSDADWTKFVPLNTGQIAVRDTPKLRAAFLARATKALIQ
ncbi:MAG: maleylpyruvate isomerase [Pseudomonadota bacterium]